MCIKLEICSMQPVMQLMYLAVVRGLSYSLPPAPPVLAAAAPCLPTADHQTPQIQEAEPVQDCKGTNGHQQQQQLPPVPAHQQSVKAESLHMPEGLADDCGSMIHLHVQCHKVHATA